ncbi:MAG: hypothetical protein GY856_00215 [bacterium]|nr:hypothetical protein [bacterium]
MKRFMLVPGILIAVIAAAPAQPTEDAATSGRGDPVAIVCLIRGIATIEAPGASGRELELLDLLVPGAVIRTSAGGSMVVAFADGSRFEIAENARAVIEAETIATEQEKLRELPPVPALAQLSPIAGDQKTGQRAATGRIRDDGADDGEGLVLDPPSGARILADGATLSFEPLEGYQSYRLTVQEESRGETVFDVETSAASVAVPPGILRPGATYYWVVRTLDSERPPVRTGAVLSTLGEQEDRARAALVEQIRTADDASLLVLLARIDRTLGLDREACRDLATAAAKLAEPSQVSHLRKKLRCPTSKVQGQ